MTIDTYSKACWTTAHSGQKATHAKRHFLQCFATLGLPQQVKTNSGPCFISKTLKEFFQRWTISHTTWIPYNPQGKAIVKRHHQYLKEVLKKQKGGEVSPHLQLQRALLAINILNFQKSDEQNRF